MLKPNFEEADGLGINKLANLSRPKMFWVYLKNLSIPKNLRTLKTNVEEADGLGNSDGNVVILSKFDGWRSYQIL